jgi:hypothetical protein
LIDYSIYRKSNMSGHLSVEFNKWSAQKDKVVFTDNIFAWKRLGYYPFKDMSDLTLLTLRRFGYES